MQYRPNCLSGSGMREARSRHSLEATGSPKDAPFEEGSSAQKEEQSQFWSAATWAPASVEAR